MRLDDWQKWFDEQFFDTNPSRQPESSVEEETEVVDAVEAPGVSPVAPQAFANPEPPRAPRFVAPSRTEPDEGGEIPSIEQYLPFLNRRQTDVPQAPPPAPPEPEPESGISVPPVEEHAAHDRGSAAPEPSLATTTDLESSDVEPTFAEAEVDLERASAGAVARRAPAKRAAASGADAKPMTTEEFWRLTPRHLHKLIALGEDEVTQRSYKRQFKESRLALIERLLDPTLSLEDAARLLGVCPTTVRRYSNRGLLRHQRTSGDQRRFKLSDVLAFLEAQTDDDALVRRR